MTEVIENIPTLSDIVQTGDESMLNHFDAHQFNEAQRDSTEKTQEHYHEDTPEPDEQHLMEVSDIFENTTTLEKPASELEEIPSIKLDNEHHAHIANEDFSDAMQLISEDSFNSGSETFMPKTNQFDKDILKEKIHLAIKEILPAIEEQLKEQLYKKLDL